jgi:hypothetical protein
MLNAFLMFSSADAKFPGTPTGLGPEPTRENPGGVSVHRSSTGQDFDLFAAQVFPKSDPWGE